MLLLKDMTSFSTQNPALRILKPWWDVISEYLNIFMVMLSVFAAGLQVSYERMTCLPVPPGFSVTDKTWNITSLNELETAVRKTGFQTFLDLQYYALLNQWCYDNAMFAYSKYFPYLILVNSLIFLVSSNFWFKFPGTSSKIEHFIHVLGKCLDSPWTTKALSETVYEDKRRYSAEVITSLINPNMPVTTEGKLEHVARPLQGGGPIEETEVIIKATEKIDGVAFDQSPGKILDKKEGEQAKALFERVKMFRVHTEKKDILYQMYKRQAFLRTIESIVFAGYVAFFTPLMKQITYCTDSLNITGFTNYYCVHALWRMYLMMSIIYLFALAVYMLLCFYTIYWIFHFKLKAYSFEAARKESGISDIPDAVNDFAFLLHLIDQYDRLYSWKFAVFLSDVSETKLLQINLNNYWTIDKLSKCLSINSKGKTEMRLFMVPAIPIKVFLLKEIEVLRLEFIRSPIIPSAVTNLTDLQELHIHNSSVKIEPQAINFLKQNLVVLKVHFSSPLELPNWMYDMWKLQELYLYGKLQFQKSIINFQSFRELKEVRVLHLQVATGKLSPTILDLASTLTHLTIHNEGIKFISVSSLKKFSNLTHLRLISCNLERIPNSIFSLSSMKKIDLTNNNLKSLEELTSFQNFKMLTSLKLSENDITSVPAGIEKISSINSLQLNNNLLSSLSTSICNLKLLSYLDVSHNVIEKLPIEIGLLQKLEYFDISHNIISMLPKELFTCINLQILLLSHNRIKMLPSLIGNLVKLSTLSLTGNALTALPQELAMCAALTMEHFIVESELFATLPDHVQNQLENRVKGKDAPETPQVQEEP